MTVVGRAHACTWCSQRLLAVAARCDIWFVCQSCDGRPDERIRIT